MAALRLWAWPATLVRGLRAHYLAKALLNAPQVLGSLDLMFNPTGALSATPPLVCCASRLPLAGHLRLAPTCCAMWRTAIPASITAASLTLLSGGFAVVGVHLRRTTNFRAMHMHPVEMQAWCGLSLLGWATW